MSSRIKSDVRKLFEFWCEVALIQNADRNSLSNQAMTPADIIESFPEGYCDKKTMLDIPAFAFPCKIESDSVQFYSFVLTTDDSKWRFGFCRHDPKTDTAMVLITYLPWHDTFLRLLALLAELRRSDNNATDEFRSFIAEVYSRGVPDPGKSVKVYYNGGQNNFVLERPLQFQLPSIPENHNLNLYYNFVDPKNMIDVFAAMLAERRIIFTSRRLDRLSSCIQAANAFLYPMVWQHIFIPVLPMKLKDYLSAPMPYLIGVPQIVLDTMTPEELGDVVILNCDKKCFESPFDDVREMPADIVSHMKKQLSHSHEHIGDRVSKIFLGVLVQLISGYRDAVEFRGVGKTFNRRKFIESRPKHLRPFLTKMMDLQIFQQFIDERLQMLNTGLGYSDEFEVEAARFSEKMKKRRHYEFLNNVREKVKEGSRGVKSAYKDLKSKFRDITPPNNSTPRFRSHLASHSRDRADGTTAGNEYAFSVDATYVRTKSIAGHHSAPSSPIFGNKRAASGATGGHSSTATCFKYASPEDLNDSNQYMRRAPPLAMSTSSTHIRPNGSMGNTHGTAHLPVNLAPSPTVSPAGSLCLSEMNLSQELQNHPLFKPPHVDRSLKPSHRLDTHSQTHHKSYYNPHRHHHRQYSQSTSSKHQLEYHRQQTQDQRRLTAPRAGGTPPPRPPPPAPHLLKKLTAGSTTSPVNLLYTGGTPVSYYNHPQVRAPQTALGLHSYIVSKLPLKDEKAEELEMSKTSMHTSPTTSERIVAHDSSYDRPPDMPPPLPPRRQSIGNSDIFYLDNDLTVPLPSSSAAVDGGSNAIAMAAAAVHAGVQSLEHNLWKDNMHRSLLPHDVLRNLSSTSKSIAAAMSTASFVSSGGSFRSAVSSSFFHQRRDEYADTTAVAASERITPVPAPRQKKESLRSLQTQHLLKSTAPSSTSSQEDTMNDLITLEDSHNASFEIEDFDPLNPNARPLPLRSGSATASSAIFNSIKSVTLPANTNALSNTSSTISNPLYPFHTPQHLISPHTRAQPQLAAAQLQDPPSIPPPLPTSQPPPMPARDEDFELLRRYGLDHFTLIPASTTLTTTTTMATTASDSSDAAASDLHNPKVSSTSNIVSGRHNWTKFE
ncbi:uncharacterized protein LOC129244809 isoform X2 [Anastrepha obliqua]|uniref:uncharacterized protein LOC129244809 isoform X2 n=1 Tax=Anastrepha obliqua TaxID=95512 RepID=UPI0024099B1D|nr:uncharacterized protein LOC129244809 isoform X2 [Anastrepha obliqua]